MTTIKVNYSCRIKAVTAQGETIGDQYTGSFTLGKGFDCDPGEEEFIILPEILREAMYTLNDLKNGKMGFFHAKSIDFSVTDYTIEFVDE